ncbi:histidine kinase [Streptomyces sp. GC420]|uniref:sensor histidine kinase n=1 Tax=Streptomyces sp. GC420 TaxID=2697568 RepID=UPI0014152553|nr:histidine kinase [Streptomyces sp. GC420]NBM14869.1 two-component sensor histidine kinase [Streptomyces sp. GC420]
MKPFPRPSRDGLLIGAVGLLGGVLLWALGLHLRTDYAPVRGWPALVPLVMTAALEPLRRTAPRAALLAGTAALLADQFTQGNIATVVMFTDLVYAAVLYGPATAARRIPVVTGLVSVAVTVTLLAWFRTPEAVLVGVVTALVGFAPATTGAIVRNHRSAAETARLQAGQTALLAEMDRVQAVTAERSRMARELHDMVANHLSAIAIHSTAALSIDDPRTTRDALTVIRENSVEGLAEMRRLIGLLRDSGGSDREPTAAPTLDGLGSLVEQARVNGAPSGLTFVLDDRTGAAAPRRRGSGGQAAGGGRADKGSGSRARLPAPVELAAYRIVQESLTNAIKHAAPGEVRIVLAHDRPAAGTGRPVSGAAEGTGTLSVTVTSPHRDTSDPRAPGAGAGLVGMRERAALLGGTFEAGPVTVAGARTWRVRAELPADREGRPPAGDVRADLR